MSNLVTVVDSMVMYNEMYESRTKIFSHTHTGRLTCEVMDVLTPWEESFHNAYVYQISTMHT